MEDNTAPKHPGEVLLLDVMIPLRLTPTKLAKALRVFPARIEYIVKNVLE